MHQAATNATRVLWQQRWRMPHINWTQLAKRAPNVASSPLTYATNVKAPILIIQGRNDTRTPPRQVEVYEARLRELGKSIIVQWYNTGHAGGDIELAVQHLELMLRFACGLIGKEMSI